MRCLVTGGAGYIGSHTTLELLQEGYDVVVLDNLCNSSFEALRRVATLSGRAPVFVHGDIRDVNVLDDIFLKYEIDAVLHFAGLKSVSDSTANPLEYFDNNVCGTINLCRAMSRAEVYKLIFSSSATVYGDCEKMPVNESMSTGQPKNPYGRSKLMMEDVLRDLAISDSRWSVALLRYFNPVGAHPSGLIGEDSKGIPSNLLPYIGQVAVGKIKELTVFGGDYPTIDGTGLRDYIHVLDLARGHLKALNVIRRLGGVNVWNLGTGRGYTVLEVVKVYEQVSKRSVPYRIVERRRGDVAASWADSNKALVELGWRAEYDLLSMINDSWRWQSLNPNGYSL